MKDFTMDPLTKHVRGSRTGRWCCRMNGKFIFSLFTLIFLILPFNQLYSQKNTAENIQGIAPVITPPGGFEIDGNASAETAGDWESDAVNELAGLFLSTLLPEDFETGTPEFLFDPPYRDLSFFYRDGITNNDPTIFTSSNKIDDDPETYTWGAGSSPNKNEIQTAVVHFTYGDPTHPNGNNTTADDLWVVFAADRQVTNGSSYIDFEFLQNSLIRTGIEAGSGGFQSDGTDGGRTLGDLLVTVEFTIGGAAAKVVIREWVFENGEYFYREFPNYPENTIFGTVNTAVTPVPWPVYFTDPMPDGSYQYEINQWAEGAVNLSYYFGSDDPCFSISTLFVRTRTSGSSGTSELKDFPRLEQLELDLRQEITVTDPDPVCSPATVDLTAEGVATGCTGTLSYWNDAEATDEVDNPSAVGDGTYYIKCTSDQNDQCFDIKPVNVTVDITPDITVTDPDAVCFPETVDITGAASGCGEGYTISYWKDEAATVSLGSPEAVAESGTYYIKCVNNDNAACYEIEPVVVTISDTPDITITDPDPVCSPETADITGAASGCGEGYTLTYWEDEGATIVLEDPDSVGEGTYYIKCTNDTNADCFDVKAVNVVVDDTPSISIVNPDPVCDPETVDLTADGIVLNCSGNLSYWTDAEAINNPVPDPTAVGGGTYYVKCTNPDNDNCFDIKMVSVTANDVPEITVTDPDPVCAPSTVDITQASSGCGEDATLSYWEDAGATVPLANPDAVAISGTYYIKCTNNENENCYDIEPVNVTVSDTPELSVMDPDPVCAPETVDLTGVFSGCGEGYTVSFWNDAEATSSLLNPDAVGVSGTYYIKCVNNENTDCYDIKPVVVTIEICDQDACTLGYWKNHTDQWECYSTCTLYSEVFGIDFSVYSGNSDDSDLTLLEALNLGGGGIYNLARQSVAALLNECHGDVSYPYTGDLIQDVYDAFVGGSAGQLASELDMINNAYECPLGGSSATTAPSDSCPSVEAFSVSPVPFKDVINIKHEMNMSNVSIQIFDIRGNMVKSLSVPSAAAGQITTIQADFVRGTQMYMIKVSSDQGSFTKSVVSGK
ncbi:T9SS type A sorting domain-containing protein [Salinimicrobium gaetbulicola]|uniref:T9SS type A sorting domain-containing protein n=1 Tax=Salinimicrobium gaetbulicola TaxID=999702 RepID=A0ABW3IB89_9FLAO